MKRHRMDTLCLGYVSESNNDQLIENFMKYWSQILNDTVCAELVSQNVSAEEEGSVRGSSVLQAFV